eukprot:3965490-Amphidinium_carterae.1
MLRGSSPCASLERVSQPLPDACGSATDIAIWIDRQYSNDTDPPFQCHVAFAFCQLPVSVPAKLLAGKFAFLP